MDAIQKLYYALGQLAYVIAQADGKIQSEEKDKLHDLVVKCTEGHDLEFDYSEIVFLLLEKEGQDSKSTYNMAMATFKSLKYFFTDEIKSRFLEVLQGIADAYPPYSIEEEEFIERIKKDFKNL